MTGAFSHDTAVRRLTADGARTRYAAEVRPGWDIAGNANGGYLIAIGARAMADAVDRPPATVTAHYLRPAPAGPCTIDVEAIRTGRRFATATATLAMDGAPTLQLLGTFGESQSGGPAVVSEPPIDLPPFEQCQPPLPAGDGQPAPAIHDRVDVRYRPGDDDFRIGQPTGIAETAAWFAFHDGEPIDAIALLLAADVFAPAVFNTALPIAWVPTIELTVHVRGTPVPGPLKCRFRSRFIQDGMLDEDGEIWDSGGTLVAQSRQLALLPR